MLEIYDMAQMLQEITSTEWHVDHIVPLQSPYVCGLHTYANLRVASSFSNLSKSNRYWNDMWEPSLDSP